MEFYPKPGKARIVQIDSNPDRIGLRCPVEVGLAGDCKRVLEALTPQIRQKKDRGFLETAQKNMKQWNELMMKRATNTDKPLKPQVVAHAVNKYLADDAVISTDCGAVTSWAARYIQMREKMLFTASGLLATMGNGVPYAVAAACAFPGRQVVALVGDGGFTMMMMEMATLVKYKLPVKVIIFKNNTLGQIKWEQMVFEGNPEFGVDLQPIDFAAYAKACGAGGFTVDEPANVDSVLREAFAHPGPALVQAVVDANEPALPGHITMTQAFHFAEALVRGEKYRIPIIRDVIKQAIRETV
jgi:pyruvate dehydrogenase (quinone)